MIADRTIGGRRRGAGTRRGRFARFLVVALLGAAPAAPVLAQDDDVDGVSRPVVQPLPGRGSYELNAALTRLAANPRDVGALIDAGNAALTLGDSEAAMGFLGRADQLSPGNPRVKTTLASAMVRSENPFEAIPLFDAAERAGASSAMIAGDRGLAYDLVGDNPSAQRYYRQALAAAPSDEIGRRLALSLAIGGDRKGFDAALLTQLQRNDPGAWRTRAFGLAILGEAEEAVKIAYGTMPRDLADGMAPYLRYMIRLTPAQQAAAANFGHFPRAAQIGRDDPRVAQYASAAPRRPARGGGPDAGLVPAGEPLGGKAAAQRAAKPGRERRKRSDDKATTASSAATPPVKTAVLSPAGAQPGRSPVPRPSAGAPAAIMARVTPTPAPAPAPPVRIAAATAPPATPPPLTVSTATAAQPPAAPAGGATVSPAVPAPAGTQPASAGRPASLPVASDQPPVRGVASAPAPAPSAPAPQPVTASSSVMAGLIPSSPPPAVAVQPSNYDLAIRAQQAATPPAAAAAPRDLASLFSDFRPPADEHRATPAAVDISKLAPAGAKPAARPDARSDAQADERGPLPGAPSGTRRGLTVEAASSAAAKGAKGAAADKAAKVAAPSHPSRIWVQLATGRDKAALGFDWRRMSRQAAELFKGKKGWTTPWGQANRLLAGPFESQAAAQAFLKELGKKNLEGFVWTSPAGQAIDALASK